MVVEMLMGVSLVNDTSGAVGHDYVCPTGEACLPGWWPADIY